MPVFAGALRTPICRGLSGYARPAAHTPEIGAVGGDVMRTIEKDNRSLKNVLPKIYSNPDIDKRVLGDVVDLIININMFEHGGGKDLLGRTY